MPRLAQLLDVLEAFHGVQTPNWPTDPYLFLVWWHCGYPASDRACAKGWAVLTAQVGVEPDQLLSANPSRLALALKAGGMMPELRAMRLKEIAERVQKEFGGDLPTALRERSLLQARAALRKFPNIGDPGIDRILLFAGMSKMAAVPSNCPHVLVRIQSGQEHESYSRTYSDAKRIIEEALPMRSDVLIRAYLLLKVHGQQLCKRSNPKCDACPVVASCAYFAGKARGRSSPTIQHS